MTFFFPKVKNLQAEVIYLQAEMENLQAKAVLRNVSGRI